MDGRNMENLNPGPSLIFWMPDKIINWVLFLFEYLPVD